jgi:hypothetical protein
VFSSAGVVISGRGKHGNRASSFIWQGTIRFWRVSSSNLWDPLKQNTVLHSTLILSVEFKYCSYWLFKVSTALCLQLETSEVIKNDEFKIA